MDPNTIVPGTGQTVGDLLNAGYSQSDIQGLMGDASAYGAPVSAGGSDGSGNVSLSNLGTIFSSIGTSVANVYRAVSGPSTNVINPRTGQPYTPAQLTALAQQNAALGPLSGVNIVPIAIIVLVAIVLLRK